MFTGGCFLGDSFSHPPVCGGDSDRTEDDCWKKAPPCTPEFITLCKCGAKGEISTGQC